MEIPRRNSTNGTSVSRRTQPSSPESDSDTIHVRVPSAKKADIASTTTTLPDSAVRAARSRSVSEHNLSLTSPLISEKPRDSVMSTPILENSDMAQHEDASSLLAARQLVLKSAPPAGGALNPIVVTDSPPRKPRNALTRKHRQQPEPHLFVGRGYENLYSSQPSRPALATKPANGSTFTGHLNEDMYRMMNAKLGATPIWNMNGHNFHNMPFEVQYPASAQFLQHGGALQIPDPYAQYHSRQPPAGGYNMLPPQDKKKVLAIEYPKLPPENEEQLRSRAIQYVHEFYRPKQRKRRLSDIDPDETSLSESEEPALVPKTSPIKGVSRPAFTTATSPLVSIKTRPPPNRKLTVYRDEDPNFELTQLTDHTELLNSLLKLYPHSKDQKGLREDISMLVSVQNQRFAAWKKGEKKAAHKKQKVKAEGKHQSHINPSNGQDEAAEALKAQQGMEKLAKMEQDNEMRGVLSAGANLWQDGSGEGVADVFDAEPQVSMGEDMKGVVGNSEVKSEV